MSNAYFQFRQFTIRHERCAMKVGTDGVLLGAWASLPAKGRVLDIGTGTGLLALMAAQRSPDVKVVAIDIDADAVCQAKANVEASPFAGRVEVLHTALQEYDAPAASFDAVLCNPPFFEESLLPPDAGRTLARHTTSLPFAALVADAGKLLADGGRFSVVLPTTSYDSFRLLCFAQGLLPERLCYVRTTPTKAPKRVLATFLKGTPETFDENTLILNEGQQRSADYAALTRDFYLW